MAVCIAFRHPLLRLIFGNVEQDVMDNSQIYFLITALSFPFIGLFDANAAFFRAEGNSRLPMTISALCNLVNIAGKCGFDLWIPYGGSRCGNFHTCFPDSDVHHYDLPSACAEAGDCDP